MGRQKLQEVTSSGQNKPQGSTHGSRRRLLVDLSSCRNSHPSNSTGLPGSPNHLALETGNGQRPSFDRRLTNLVSIGIRPPRGARRYSLSRGPEHRFSDEMFSNQALHHDDHLFHQFTGWSEATVRRCRSCVYDNFQIGSLPCGQVAFPYHCGEPLPETSRILTKGQGHYAIQN